MRWTRSPAFVALFVLVDVVVLALAWWQMRRADHVAGAAGSAVTIEPSDPPAPAVSGPLALVSSPAGRLARITRGSCDSRNPVAARVWVAGRFRGPLDEVTVPGLQEALGQTMSDARLEIVGTDQQCRIHGYVSTDAGRTWSTTSIPKSVWYLDHDTTRTAVHGPVPGGVLNVECQPIAVTTVGAGQKALISCAGYNVIAQDRAEGSAPVTYPVSSPAAAVGPAKGMPLVLGGTPNCLAALSRVTSQQETKRLTCLSQTAAPLGLAMSGRRVFVQVGYTLRYSTDGGKTFATYPGV